MSEFSLIAQSIDRLEADVEMRRALTPAEAWSESERVPDRVRRRLERSLRDYWFFKRTYFSPEQYIGGYADPAPFHRMIVKLFDQYGVHVIAGPREHAKTVEGKQYAAWRLLTARDNITGTLSSTLPKSSNMLVDIGAIIRENPRIEHDFRVEWAVRNTEQLQLRTQSPLLPSHWRFMEAFSEGKSLRGFSRQFGRPTWVLGDDIETKTSPMGEEQVRERIGFVAEAFGSMMVERRTLIWLGNNFDTRCAINRLLQEHLRGILASHWTVHTFKAWGDKGPLWKKRFPAKTEEELRAKLMPKDEADWAGNFQQDPTPPEGITFLRDSYQEFDELPDDAQGVIYCDQNLALKAMGDTTALIALVYSPSRDRYYIPRFRCLSYADPNELIRDALDLKSDRIFRIGFDGHVSQESTWTAHIRNWCRIHKRAFPHVEFKRYNVDLCATNLQTIYKGGRLLFPRGMAHSEEGARALTQFFAFRGKKAKRTDDFPDSLICANEMLHESGFVRSAPKGSGSSWTTTFTDNRLF